MNLYKLHSSPESLDHYEEAHRLVPKLFVEDGKFPKEMTSRQLNAVMKDPKHAFYYAQDVLKKRWPEAEPFIRKSSFYRDMYKKQFEIK
jgi:hypothetical protein